MIADTIDPYDHATVRANIRRGIEQGDAVAAEARRIREAELSAGMDADRAEIADLLASAFSAPTPFNLALDAAIEAARAMQGKH